MENDSGEDDYVKASQLGKPKPNKVIDCVAMPKPAFG